MADFTTDREREALDEPAMFANVRLAPTTNINLALRQSLNARDGVDAGTTWGDFQRAMRDLGVQDGDVISGIEYGVSRFGRGVVTREDDEHGAVEIREVL